jgi:hypothetical protein
LTYSEYAELNGGTIQTNSGRDYLENFNYDKEGNIRHLERHGLSYVISMVQNGVVVSTKELS